MRTWRALLVALPLVVVADGAAGESKHERTRRSAAKKSRQAQDRGHHGAEAGGASDFFGSCLSGCFSSGCDLAGDVAAEAVAGAGRDETAYVPPPAPGLEARPLPPEPLPDEGATARDLPPSLVPGEPPLPEEAATDEAPAFHDPEAYGVAAAPAPPPAPAPAGWNGEVDLRTTGGWIFADLPNASFDARASVGPRGTGPGLQVWYTGLWERIDGAWDHLPLAGARLAFGFGGGTVRPELRLGGVLLDLGAAGSIPGFDAGLGVELHPGGQGAPWIDLGVDLLAFEGFTASDLAGGISFPGGPFYVRVGVRSLYLETFYVGPEVALGLRL